MVSKASVAGRFQRCITCRYSTKGRTCPIFQRLHEMSPRLKIWSLNASNFGCNLWEPHIFGKAPGSCLDKLDHTRRLYLLEEEERNASSS